MTFAEQFNSKRQPDYASAEEFLDLVLSVDKDAIMKLQEGKVLIFFSDSSITPIVRDR